MSFRGVSFLSAALAALVLAGPCLAQQDTETARRQAEIDADLARAKIGDLEKQEQQARDVDGDDAIKIREYEAKIGEEQRREEEADEFGEENRD